MLFAAGLGTRLYPLTQSRPKALVEVNGITLLERNIRYLQSYEIEEIIVNVHHFSEQIIAAIDSINCEVQIVISDESNQVLETGGGLVKAKEHFTEDFLVMNVDILTDLNIDDFWNNHNKNQSMATLAVTQRESSRKLLFDDQMILSGWKNEKTQEMVLRKDTKEETLKALAFSGVHILSPKIFEFMPNSGKFSIIQPYLEMMNSQTIKAYDHSGDVLIDVGKPEAISIAEQWFE